MALANKDISYLSKDFNDIRSQLINYSQTYFPNTYTDFSPTSPGMMFIEQAAYVSDVLSFYLDTQIQETYLQYAKQFDNLYDLAYMFSYKPRATGLASVDIDIYQQLPTKVEGTTIVPDYSYALVVEENTVVTTQTGNSFIISEALDFSVSSSNDPTEESVAQIASGEPVYYLIKKTRKATSGIINSADYTLGNYQAFPTLTINSANIGGIIDIVDSEGNEYYEVDYLGQDFIYDSIKNTNTNDPNNYENGDAPYVLRTKSTNRRFVTRFLNETTLQIQFGGGEALQIDEQITPNPDNVGIGLPFGQSKLTTAFSPTNFVFTNTYGAAPSNTTLTVRYLTGGGTPSNVNANTINIINTGTVKFKNSNLQSNDTAQYIFNSIAVLNPTAASGGGDGDTIEEIRQNALANYNTQQRNVTADDYLIRALSMPPKFGVIAKAFTTKPNIKDTDTILDLYILSYNQNNKLVRASSTIKNNLITYLNQSRMIGDTVDIKDAFVINICIEFDIITLPNVINSDVIARCIQELQIYFDINKWQINQPIIMREIIVLLDKIPGVQSVQNLNIINKAGTNSGYSQYAYDIKGATQGGIIYPSLDPSIFEVKYPNNDITGRVVTLGTGTFSSFGGTSTGAGY
tara:strand:- start:2207 stop:4099 length:1893 start_codon:yes stop_codon:yes gene_type:complete